jgi:anionic cell wall polymer biosynthesis LytR-Cps2A-Psr (LCP) family protein
LEVVPAKEGFKITTNIPKAGEKQAAVSKNTDSIPVVTFNASVQDFLLAEDGRAIEISL